jgi:hypothetical protein
MFLISKYFSFLDFHDSSSDIFIVSMFSLEIFIYLHPKCCLPLFTLTEFLLPVPFASERVGPLTLVCQFQLPAQATIPSQTLNYHRWRNQSFPRKIQIHTLSFHKFSLSKDNNRKEAIQGRKSRPKTSKKVILQQT